MKRKCCFSAGPRFWFLIVYCALLFAGTYVIVSRSSPYPSGLVVSRELAGNRLLQAGDVAPVAGSGQYLTRPIKAGSAIQPGDIAAFPKLSFSEGDLPLALPVRSDLVASGALNAGSAVRICKASDEVFQNVPVHAVFCPLAGTECLAVVVLKAPKGEDISKAFVKDTRTYLQLTDVVPPCK